MSYKFTDREGFVAESTGLDKAIAFVKDACLHGKKIDIKASGNGDISFSKGVNGEVVVSGSEIGRWSATQVKPYEKKKTTKSVNVCNHTSPL